MLMLKRMGLELFKIAPLLILILVGAMYFGDASQLKLAGYYLAAIAVSAIFWHVCRKFLYPTFSLEKHCASALEGNLAAAVVVFAFLLFQVAYTWLLVLCLVAMVTK